MAGGSPSYSNLVVPLIVTGIGTSAALPVTQAAIIGAVGERDIGKAAGVNNMFQELGGAFGVALGVAAFSAAGGHLTPADFADGFVRCDGRRGHARRRGALLVPHHPQIRKTVTMPTTRATTSLNGIRRRTTASHSRPRAVETARRSTRSSHRCATRLLAHCYRMLGSIHDADDALQDTMLRAWKGLPGFDGRSEFSTWLYRIATNASLDAISRNARRVLPVDLTVGRGSRRGSGAVDRTVRARDRSPKAPRPPWSAASRSSWRS